MSSTPPQINMLFGGFFNANAGCFQMYLLFFYDGHVRLINVTVQSIDRAAQFFDCAVNLNLIKHYNVKFKIEVMLPS